MEGKNIFIDSGQVSPNPNASRLLMTIMDRPCPFGCKYCFGRFSQYKQPIALDKLDSHKNLLEKVSVIYPACDIDLFAYSDATHILRELMPYNRSISVSTKARLNEQTVAQLSNLATSMARASLILKIGISFSTKYAIEQIEPGTASYEERLFNLKLLSEYQVPTCVILKPVLPFIPIDEYLAIVNDTSKLSGSYLSGGTYLDVNNLLGAFEDDSLEYELESPVFQSVGWAINEPIWPVIQCHSKRLVIRNHVLELGLSHFDSDVELMDSLNPL